MAAQASRCPKCNRILSIVKERSVLICMHCRARLTNPQLQLEKNVQGIDYYHLETSANPPTLPLVCNSVKKRLTTRRFFRRTHHEESSLPPLKLPTAALASSHTIQTGLYQTINHRQPIQRDVPSGALPPLMSQPHRSQRDQDVPGKEQLQLPEINQRGGRINQLKGLFSSSDRTLKVSPGPSDYSPVSAISDQFLQVPLGDVCSSLEESGSDWSVSSSDQNTRPRITSLEDLKQIYQEAAKTSCYDYLQELLYNTFSHWSNMLLSFKDAAIVDDWSVGINTILLDYVYEILLKLPNSVQKQVLKAQISGQLKEAKRSKACCCDHDYIRCHFILLQNPQFHSVKTYTVFAQLLRQIASLSEANISCLVIWLRSLRQARFRELINTLAQFISVRLFPPDSSLLPSISKCTWWIPSAARVLGFINRANCHAHPPIVSHTEFYNTALNNTDLMAEFNSWQSPQGYATMRFSFCQYPFMLSMAAKQMILQGDSQKQMLTVARHTLFSKRRWSRDLDSCDMFLNIEVDRSQLVEDSINELMHKHHDLNKKVRVRFKGESGVDLGGLTKEWFLLLTRKIFQPEYGLFVYHEDSGLYWFSNSFDRGDCGAYHLVGLLMGLAVYNSIILDIHFPLVCYKKLLTKTKIAKKTKRRKPSRIDKPVGYFNVGLHDLTELMPTVGNSMQELLAYEGNVEDDLQCSFEVSFKLFDTTITEELVPSGKSIRVNNSNRSNFVSVYVDYVLNKSVAQQFTAFYEGFHSVCNSAALKLFRPEEVEILVCGCNELDVHQLELITQYEGYTRESRTIKTFWEVVSELTPLQHKRLLHFVTGSDRVPFGGTSNLSFVISKWDSPLYLSEMLPTAQTCFNLLLLPPYTSRDVLKHKLIIAIDNAEGFGIE